MVNGLIYIGDGDHIPGVPARDLTPAEVEIYGTAIDNTPGQPLYERPLTKDDENGNIRSLSGE